LFTIIFRYVLGHEAMRRMQNSNVLIMGMKGLGLEIAKNVILAGVKSVTIWDSGLVEIADLGAQYYLKEDDVGKRRDLCSVSHLAELNTYVPVKVLETEANRVSEIEFERELKEFQVFVLTEGSLEDQLYLNEYSHAKGKAFITADTVGLFASVFCDFGEEFVTMDATGEQSVSGMISAITQETESIVTCLEDQRHGLEDGDMVKFKEIKGMPELNGSHQLRKVKVLSPFTFSIGDTSNLSRYETGGVFEQVKQPKKFSFKKLGDSLKSPEFVISDFAKMDRMPQILAAFTALAKCRISRDSVLGRRPRNSEDAKSFVEQVRTLINDKSVADMEIDESLITEFGRQLSGYLAPMCAVIGGMVAQEVLKASSGKFGPVVQHFVFDSLESMPVDLSPVESDFAPQGSRYDSQIAVFGTAFQKRIEESQGFLVGSGAIGCEMVKLYALMGVAAGNERGLLTLTDMDNIEKSNLNRQFLFRPADVGKPKSLTAAEAAFHINPNVKIEAKVDRVGAETENIFNTEFFESLDFVTNALDNVDARRYMDQRCVFYRRPLLESGTLGTKGNTQVVVPHLTESYSSSQDPPEKTIPFCTLHNFPNNNEHTIEWAMDFFSGTFKGDPETLNRFLHYQGETKGVVGVPPEFESQKDRLEAVLKNMQAPATFEECITWACLRFQELFSSNIKQLLFNFPKDSITSSGTPFWSGPKRAPNPIEFDADNEVHMNFVWAAAHLRAFVYGLSDAGVSREAAKAVAESVKFPEFVPKNGVKIAANDSEAAASNGASPTANDSEVKELIKKIQSHYIPSQSMVRVHDFEKDDDSNHHIDFVTACANLRAINYEITPTDRHHVKLIAGKIIPAIATTTALVSGLVALELYKVLDGPRMKYEKIEDLGGVDTENSDFSRYWNLDRFKNGFVNLALPFFAFSSPLPAPKFSLKGGRLTFTLWDSFRIKLSQVGDLKTLIEKIKEDCGLEVSMISSGPSLVYSSYMPKTTTPERMTMPLDQLIAFVSKKAIGAHVDVLTLEALCEDESGEDVEFPYITLYLKK
jgi:ubiquitin-activating enzyme E1